MSRVWVSVFIITLDIYVCTYIRTYSAYMNVPVLLEAEVTDGQSMESSSKYGTEAASSDDHLPSNSTQPDMQVCVYIFLCSTLVIKNMENVFLYSSTKPCLFCQTVWKGFIVRIFIVSFTRTVWMLN